MSVVVKLNGQKLDLSNIPDLLLDFHLAITDLEEMIKSIDKRLYNLEKKMVRVNIEDLVTITSDYKIIRKTT